MYLSSLNFFLSYIFFLHNTHTHLKHNAYSPVAYMNETSGVVVFSPHVPDKPHPVVNHRPTPTRKESVSSHIHIGATYPATCSSSPIKARSMVMIIHCVTPILKQSTRNDSSSTFDVFLHTFMFTGNTLCYFFRLRM